MSGRPMKVHLAADTLRLRYGARVGAALCGAGSLDLPLTRELKDSSCKHCQAIYMNAPAHLVAGPAS
jgi:hypothetical protein